MRCSECGGWLQRYTANGFRRWPCVCSKECARKRKSRLQFEKRQRDCEERIWRAGNVPMGGFNYFVPPVSGSGAVCLTGAAMKQASVGTDGQLPLPCLCVTTPQEGTVNHKP